MRYTSQKLQSNLGKFCSRTVPENWKSLRKKCLGRPVIGTAWKLTFSNFRNTMLQNLFHLAFWENQFWLSFIKQILASKSCRNENGIVILENFNQTFTSQNYL